MWPPDWLSWWRHLDLARTRPAVDLKFRNYIMQENLVANLPDLSLNIGRIVVLTVASDEVDRIIVETSHVFALKPFTGIFGTFTLRPLFIRHCEIC